MCLEVPDSKPSDQQWLHNLWGPVQNGSVGLLLKNSKDFRTEQQNMKPNLSGSFYVQGPVEYYTGPTPMKLALFLTPAFSPHIYLLLAPLLFLCVPWKFRGFNLCDGDAWDAEVEGGAAPPVDGIESLHTSWEVRWRQPGSFLYFVTDSRCLWTSLNNSLKMSLENTVSMSYSEGYRWMWLFQKFFVSVREGDLVLSDGQVQWSKGESGYKAGWTSLRQLLCNFPLNIPAQRSMLGVVINSMTS